MASFTSRLMLVMAMAVLVVFSLFKPSVSTSRNAFNGHREMRLTTPVNGFRVELRHVDHGKRLTKSERIRRAVMRGKNRLGQLSQTTSTAEAITTMAATAPSTVIRAPIHPGDGEFLMSVAIGTPPLHFSAIVDTGSDLIWTQCKPCLQCYDQPTPIFNPANSSSYSKLSCTSPLCASLPLPACSSTNSDDYADADAYCTYTYQYGDYSTTSGTLSTETFTFSSNSSSSSVAISHIGFGCGDDNEGGGFNQGGGLIGLGRGPLSLVSQLNEPKFAYCLNSINSNVGHDGTLLMGSFADVSNLKVKPSSTVAVTPLARNPVQPSFYYLNLTAISVGGERLLIPPSTFELKEDGTGGMIIDSGTTITYIEESAYKALREEFVNRTKLEVVDEAAVQKTGLDLCFKVPEGGGSEELEVPTVVFHFESADLALPADNYMVGIRGEGEETMVCLAMGGASGMSVFGNIQQQDMMVLHDLTKESLSFVPVKCDAL